jgi:NADH-quinone oxidoreductase subunit J
MTWPFAILAVLTVGGAVAAMSLRNLVHCALALAVTFAGLAALFLLLDAQFAGFAQILVYIGAVAILIVFAILLTRGSELPSRAIFSTTWAVGLGVATVVFAILGGMILSSTAAAREGAAAEAPQATVRQIGDQLMTKYVLPLEVTGLLLTAALIGAVIIAMREQEACPTSLR